MGIYTHRSSSLVLAHPAACVNAALSQVVMELDAQSGRTVGHLANRKFTNKATLMQMDPLFRPASS